MLQIVTNKVIKFRTKSDSRKYFRLMIRNLFLSLRLMDKQKKMSSTNVRRPALLEQFQNRSDLKMSIRKNLDSFHKYRTFFQYLGTCAHNY